MSRARRTDPSREEVRNELAAEPRLSWLLRRKVAVPDRTPGYLDRARLMQRALPTRHRLTVLLAPGGFGKTTLLAECCRALSESGIVTAWLSVDQSDDADVLDSYIPFAFQYAGLGIEGVSDRDGATPNRVGLLAHALEARAEPFVLAIDDLHQLSDPGAVAHLDFLIRRGPPNLHLAAACRHLPQGLDVGGSVLDGGAVLIRADELRFTKSEISAFFDLHLSRSELASLAQESAGWPMALRIRRNAPGAVRQVGDARSIVENWVESRLWEGIDTEDRELVLDTGLFEWMDAALLDEVLGPNDSMRRIQTMQALAGLLEPVPSSGPDAWRLHSLIREHCSLQRFRDTRARFREVHRRIAVALARRGETLLAIRHATESRDGELAGTIVEEAGAIRLWLRYGLAQFRAAIELLDEEVLEARPRLRFARCAALLFAGRLEQAREAYGSIDRDVYFRPEPRDEASFEQWLDFCILRGLVLLYGGGTVGSKRTTAAVSDYLKIVDCETADPLVRSYAEISLCIVHNVKAQFELALERANSARASFGASGYGRMMVEFQRGQIAMARGRIETARECYTTAMRVARASYVHEPVWAAIATAFQRELDLERNRLGASSQPPGVPATLTKTGTPLQAYAAACGVATGRALAELGPEHALELLDSIAQFVRGARLTPLANVVTAMQVSLLVEAGRTDAAERLWREEELPSDARACLDLERQTWREMEALGAAWLRLSIARERFDEARCFAAELHATAQARGLRRTLMRTLVLCIVLEERAGDPAAANVHLADYLALFAETDYAHPVVVERRSCSPALVRFADGAGDSPLRACAESLLVAMRKADADRTLNLSAREREILSRLDGQSDREIGDELGLTVHGVRYHLRGLFSKLAAKNRTEAVRRARELGLFSAEG